MQFKEYVGYASSNNQIIPDAFKQALKNLLFADQIAVLTNASTKNQVALDYVTEDGMTVETLYDNSQKVVKWRAIKMGTTLTPVDINNRGTERTTYAVSLAMLQIVNALVQSEVSMLNAFDSILSFMISIDALEQNFNAFAEIREMYQFCSDHADDFLGDMMSVEALNQRPPLTNVTADVLKRDTTIDEEAEEAKEEVSLEHLKAFVQPVIQSYYDSLSEDDKALIPTEEDMKNYLPSTIFANVVKMVKYGLENGDMSCQNILLKGPPGVGKSKMAVALAYVFQMPYRYTQGYKTMDASEYRGTTIANNGVLDTKTDTPIAETARRGGVFVDEDNNYSNEGENTVKNSLLVAPYSMVLADMTTVRRHPFSIFVMTANPEMKGARPINEAYKDRHFIILDLESPEDDVLTTMIMNESGITNQAIASKMVTCYHAINNKIVNESEFADQLTPRSLMNWGKQAKILGNAIEAAKYNVIGAVCASEEFRSEIFDSIIVPRFGNGRVE